MRKTDAERRAFLKSLKPRLVSIAESAAEKSGLIDEADLHARIEEGRNEYHRELAMAHALAPN
jgi:hypothetical protein